MRPYFEEEEDPTQSLLDSRLYPPPGDAGEDEVEGQGYQDDGTAVPVALVALLEKRAEAADATVLTFPLRRRANLWSNCGSCF